MKREKNPFRFDPERMNERKKIFESGRHNVAGSINSGGTDEPEDNRRHININEEQISKFCSNKVSTAKYSLFSFLPIFLFEQFRKYSNIFFLFIALLQQIPDVSPTGRYTTLIPLVFILTVSAVKEIVEDFKRHRADRETNHRKAEVLRNGHWDDVKWRNVVVGDIVKIRNNQFFPADVVLLSSSEPQAICFVETSNLDGETNLKIRQGLSATSYILETKDLISLKGSLQCEIPNRLLYEFKGVLHLSGERSLPLGPDQVLLRGAQLRNTTWVFGIVIYTGHETKLMKNSSRVPLKRSSVDKMTNVQILMLFFILIVLCLVSAIFNELWTRVHWEKDWYIALSQLDNSNFGFNLLTFIILYNNLIPISLQVSIEVVRIVQASFINMDLDMYYEESDTPAMARTSNLNEELGMVKYVFSDKTGTLTRNIMEFKKCSIAGIMYTIDDPNLVENYRNHKNKEYVKLFMELLSVCHTVIPEKVDGGLVYQAASPDERALVNGAKSYGWTFVTRTPDFVEVNVLGTLQRFIILNVIEFTSKRKRMSVIVKDPKGIIKIFCKGADSVIYERLSPSSQEFRAKTLKDLEDMATEGLRTLCCAYAEIKDEIYQKWKETYYKAVTSIQNRESKIEDAANLIEVNLTLLGATAIEDKLQDQVPETIESLLKADIKVWVLTGDKQETAINIGYSCKLISSGMILIFLNEESLDGTREAISKHIAELGDSLRRPNDIALIVDGKTLKYALSCDVKRDFLDLCTSCKVVICCRVSPSQKADVVDLVSKMTKSITLAIGDGANDVAMIQKANIGVGISGVEGLQAACASDYSIAQFKYLVKLLLVHGAWNYNRMCKLILYSFYKNVCLYVIELWFAIYSGWSGQVLFEKWSIGAYNVIFTAAPPLALGLFDKVCSAEARLTYCKLYKPSQNAQYFNFRVFWIWILNALFHSILLFWLPLLALEQDSIWKTGSVGGYLTLGNVVYTYVIVTVCLKAGLITSSWNLLTHFAIWGSIGLWFGFVVLCSNIWPTIPFEVVMVGQDQMIFSSFIFWLGLIAIPITALLLDVIFLTIKNTIFKTFTDQIRENEIRRRDGPQIVAAEFTTTVQDESGSKSKEPLATSVASVVRRKLQQLNQNKTCVLYYNNYIYIYNELIDALSETARLLRSVKCALTRRGTAVTELELSHGYAFSQEEGGVITQSQVIRAYNTNIPKPIGI
ncbi:conserved hypothetical protein [Pediculus humanus corporis]|uniref:Phospholipid-transporting ATPase n=1 Tax=Pediculus humanus subsp. corporis TaxID=121224 RepID=E0VAM5_PEDHC|nr:uncharacterized protein Phum_PHUM041040 [Pediculus humanus corporis]EEB10431.1 conserved hypothetical protein [Pediculus humanus corporis]